LGHALALHARRTGILPVDGPAARVEALEDLGLRGGRGEQREREKHYANHGEIPLVGEAHHTPVPTRQSIAELTEKCRIYRELRPAYNAAFWVWTCVWFRRLSPLMTSSWFPPTPASSPEKSASRPG